VGEEVLFLKVVLFLFFCLFPVNRDRYLPGKHYIPGIVFSQAK
jgi:hypothetical protein